MEQPVFTLSAPSTSFCLPPPAKRARKEEMFPIAIFETQEMANRAPPRCSSQAWQRLRDTRRASLTYLMDCGASPVALDFTIDKRIFDFSEKTIFSPRNSQLPPPPFSNEDISMPPQDASSDSPAIDAAIASTKTIHNNIEKECVEKGMNKRTIEVVECSEARFRAHQTDIWTEKYEDLVQYKAENGHCLVPNSFPPNPSLAEVGSLVVTSFSASANVHDLTCLLFVRISG